MAGRLLPEQSGDTPISGTHFDVWAEAGEPLEMNYLAGGPFAVDLDSIQTDLDEEQWLPILRATIDDWRKTLGMRVGLDGYATLLHNDTLALLADYLGLKGVFDLLVFRMLEMGYDVYYSVNMVEIYKGDAVHGF